MPTDNPTAATRENQSETGGIDRETREMEKEQKYGGFSTMKYLISMRDKGEEIRL